MLRNGVIILFIGLFISLSAYTQEIEYKDGKYIKQDQAYTGEYTEVYDNGNIKVKKNLVDGLEEGLVMMYFESGNTQEQRSYTKGQKNGIWIKWNDAGIKIGEVSYQMDNKHGDWLIWDENGNKLFEMYYNKGEKVGTWKIYNTDGSLKEKREYGLD